MADSGRPLPFALKQLIKSERPKTTVRQLASTLNLSKTTVQKYGGKRGTK